jgi:hypothetical protein
MESVRSGRGGRKDDTTEILFGVIRLVHCSGTPNRKGDVFLRFKLGGVNRFRIQVKGRARLRVAEKLLNRFYVFVLANQIRI